jgi:hypothetical protein
LAPISFSVSLLRADYTIFDKKGPRTFLPTQKKPQIREKEIEEGVCVCVKGKKKGEKEKEERRKEG